MAINALKIKSIKDKLSAETSPYLLGAFRVLFACMALYSAIRFLAKGWVQQLYIEPTYHFHYYGFEWVNLPNSSFAIYGLFILMIISALGILSGRYFRWFAVSYFILFTYFELVDKTYYLNHYYFISLLALLLIFLPMNAALVLGKSAPKKHPFYFVAALRVLIGAVYFYAGIAKLNSDWLAGEPLNTWFNAFQHLPVIGDFIGQHSTAVFASYLAMFFDTILPFLLLFKSTRIWAYLAAVIFHSLTALMFPIGVFPLIMSVCALVFFPTYIWQKRLEQLKIIKQNITITLVVKKSRIALPAIFILLSFHLIMPWRYTLYGGNVMWHEQGFRFSWRVMLMEKNGFTELTVVNSDGKKYLVNNADYLTPLQEKMMSTQPDMILEYSKIIALDFEKKGFSHFKIVADSWVTLNGRKPFRMIQNNVDLRQQTTGFANQEWITTWNDEAL